MNFKKSALFLLICGVTLNFSFASSSKKEKDFLIENEIKFKKKSFNFKMNPYENLYFTENFILVPAFEKNLSIFVISKNLTELHKFRINKYKDIENSFEFKGKIYILGNFYIKGRLLRCLYEIGVKENSFNKVMCDTTVNILKRFNLPERKSGLPEIYPSDDKKILLIVRNGLVFVGFSLQRPKYQYQDGVIVLLNKNKDVLWKVRLNKDFRPDYFYNPQGIFCVKKNVFSKIDNKGNLIKIKDDIRFFTKIAKDKSFSHYYLDRLKLTGNRKFIYLINEDKSYVLPKSYCKIFDDFCISKDYFYNYKSKKVVKNSTGKEPFCKIKNYFIFKEDVLKNKGLYVNKTDTVIKFYKLSQNKFTGYLKFKVKKDTKESYYCWNDYLIRELKKGENRSIEFYKLQD